MKFLARATSKARSSGRTGAGAIQNAACLTRIKAFIFTVRQITLNSILSTQTILQPRTSTRSCKSENGMSMESRYIKEVAMAELCQERKGRTYPLRMSGGSPFLTAKQPRDQLI